MNEIRLLRNQLADERSHVRGVASACAAAHENARLPSAEARLGPFAEACAGYLVPVLGWFERRDRLLGDLYARLPPDDSGRRALERLGSEGSAREALAKLRAARAAMGVGVAGEAARGAWSELAHFIGGPWSTRRCSIDALLASNLRVTDWRAFTGIDADSVVGERSLYARVCATLPAGIQLVAAQV